jgi:NADPH-dependent curcumin reductase
MAWSSARILNFRPCRPQNLSAGEVLVRVLYLSLDPAMRGWMNEGRSYIAPVALGEVMRALGLGRVVVSKDPSLKPGDLVTGLTGVQDYAVVSAKI